MSGDPVNQGRNRGVFALAIIIILLAAAALLFNHGNPLITALGGLMCVLGVYLVKRSGRHGNASPVADARNDPEINPKKRLTAGQWAVGAVALIAVGISFYYLYRDALNGYHEIGPVYAFAAVIVVSALVFGYLVTTFLR